MTNHTLIEMKGVSKIYPKEDGSKFTVFQDINLRIRQGEFVAIIGPSGCGKTTLLDLVLGAGTPSAGTVTVDGNIVEGFSRDRGIIQQDIGLFDDLSMLDNVAEGPLLERSSFPERLLYLPSYFRKRRAARNEALRYLSETGLKEADAMKYPFELSGGMKQRVAIASAMIMRPKLLLMDEFSSKLDAGVKDDVQNFALDQWEKTGNTAILITHSLEEAAYMGTRIIALSQHFVGNTERMFGSRIVLDIEVSGGRRKDRRFKGSKECAELCELLRKTALDEDHPVDPANFILTHPDMSRSVR